MRVSQLSEMAIIAETQFMSITQYTAYNMIGNRECESLVRADRPLLVQLQLWKNKISSEGVKTLGCGKWPLLKIINLSIIGMLR